MVEYESAPKSVVKAKISNFPSVYGSYYDELFEVHVENDTYHMTNSGEFILQYWMSNVRKQFKNDNAKAYEYFVNLRNNLNQIKDDYCNINHEVILDYGYKTERLTNDAAMYVGMLAEIAAIQFFKGVTNHPDKLLLVRDVNRKNWGDTEALNAQMAEVRIINIKSIDIRETNPVNIKRLKKTRAITKIESKQKRKPEKFYKFQKLELKFALMAAATWVVAGALYGVTYMKQPQIPTEYTLRPRQTITYLTSSPGILPEEPQFTEYKQSLTIDTKIPTDINEKIKQQNEAAAAVNEVVKVEQVDAVHPQVEIQQQESAEPMKIIEIQTAQPNVSVDLNFDTHSPAIPVAYSQNDPTISNILIGYTQKTFRDAGCFLTAVASGISSHINITPAELNELLKNNNGFDAYGNLQWSAITKIFKGKVNLTKEYNVDLNKLQSNINNGSLPIVKLSSHNHWLTVHGIEKFEDKFYLHVTDPWTGSYTQISYYSIEPSSYRLLSFN